MSELAVQSALRCRWCGGEVPPHQRKDSRYCGQVHRQQAWRFFRQIGACSAPPAEVPLRVGYWDPPYIGLADYYKHHPDYAGEVDHAEVLREMDPFDGWALSTSKPGLRHILRLLDELNVRRWDIATWVRGPRVHEGTLPPQSTEFVVFRSARRESRPRPPDSLVHWASPRRGDPRHVIGAKPAAFIRWMFELVDARPGDTFVDRFPGSGRVAEAWQFYTGAQRDG